MIKIPQLLDERRGYTLVEVLVVIVIMGVIFTLISSIYNSQIKTWQAADRQVELQQNLRLTIDTLAKEIRQVSAGEISVINSAYAGNQEIVFNDVYTGGEEERLILKGGKIQKAVPDVATYVYQPLTTDEMQVVAFRVYEVFPGSSKLLKIYIKGETVGEDGAKTVLEIQSQVYPRINW